MRRFFLAAGLSLMAFSASALEYVETMPGKVYKLTISEDEHTLFGIRDADIARIDGGNFVVNQEKDKGFGKAFIKPAGPEEFTIFITDTKGRTFPILITPDEELKGGVVEIVDISPVVEVTGKDPVVFTPKGSRTEHIKNLITAMALDKKPTDMVVKAMDIEVEWWNEAQMRMLRQYSHRDMTGYVFWLVNTSGERMVLDETEFEVKHAIAASINHMKLMPGQGTHVFVVTHTPDEVK